ncbi:MAG: epoxyqueuosine reductase QueH [Acholeplasmataceae bacterium]|nr:epoxyqueuosine reductase QueH [Acholeplasmataceae bacterium]
MKVLMHMCCAPCAVYPVQTMKEKGIEIDGLYYNPNIHPFEEFQKREENVEKLAEKEGFLVHYLPDFKEDLWLALESKDQSRCNMCYEMRLKKAFEFAKEHGYDAVTTSLLVSPYQQHDVIIDIALKYAKIYNIPFYYEDFRLGYREGQKLAKEYGLYCQRYCGCILSLKERMNEIKQAL